MKKWTLVIVSAFFIGHCVSCGHPEKRTAQPSTPASAFENSLVYIQVSSSRFDIFQPWKRTPSQTEVCFGTAVGPYEIITIAEPFTYASFIQIKTRDSAQYLPAHIKVLDYDLNLCLLQIEPDNLAAPLLPVSFTEDFQKDLELTGRWLSSDASVKTSRAFIDRALVQNCPTSYQRILTFVLTSPSRKSSRGELFTDTSFRAFGIAFDSSETEVSVIPAQTINRFLREAQNSIDYSGYGTPGYEAYSLTDPSVRRYLKMPDDLKEGCYISTVYSKGTGSDVLKKGDVLLAIDRHTIDVFGKYKHPVYDDISYEHLIQLHKIGEPIVFTVFRNGDRLDLTAQTSRFDSSEMLVPYQEYGKQPEYVIIGGYVFQKLTLDYLRLWGENWQGKVPPHLMNYYRNLSMTPPAGRKEVVVLSFVLPAEINLGYQSLGRVVVKTFNGIPINEMSDILRAIDVSSESPFHIVEFEMSYPTVVIPKENLQKIDQAIFQLYGIQKPSNVF